MDEGRWRSPDGARVRFWREGDTWRTGVFLFRNSRKPFSSRALPEEEAEKLVAELAAKGYERED